MIKLMKKPDWIDNPSWYDRKCKENYFTGQQILARFFDVPVGYGSLKETYIPKELEKKNWRPKDNTTYKCWWYWTNPADPSDSGEDILVYVEECEPSQLDTLKYDTLKEINTIVSKLSIDQLKALLKHIKSCY